MVSKKEVEYSLVKKVTRLEPDFLAYGWGFTIMLVVLVLNIDKNTYPLEVGFFSGFLIGLALVSILLSWIFSKEVEVSQRFILRKK